MRTSLKAASLIAGLALALPASAINFDCQLDNLTRSISVAYPEQTPVPCQVQYTKAGETQTLWQAQNTEGYCEQQARAFVAKHESWGWQCQSRHISAQQNTTETPQIAAE